MTRAHRTRSFLRWAYEAENEEIIDMLKAAGVEESWTDRDGETAATVGSAAPGKLTKWAEAKYAREKEEAIKREAEMAAAAAAAQAAGPDEPDYDDDWDDEVRSLPFVSDSDLYPDRVLGVYRRAAVGAVLLLPPPPTRVPQSTQPIKMLPSDLQREQLLTADFRFPRSILCDVSSRRTTTGRSTTSCSGSAPTDK
eukprot:SAG22_NODE_3712_length_1562_cov_1.682160_2_plen_196_part_00